MCGELCTFVVLFFVFIAGKHTGKDDDTTHDPKPHTTVGDDDAKYLRLL